MPREGAALLVSTLKRKGGEIMAHGASNRPIALPVVQLEIEGRKRLYFADRRLGEYRNIFNPHERIQEDDLGAPMKDIIRQYRAYTIRKGDL